jgi:hypothetical protein
MQEKACTKQSPRTQKLVLKNEGKIPPRQIIICRET